MKDQYLNKIKQQLQELVEHQQKTKISWLAMVLAISEKDVKHIAKEIDLVVEQGFIINSDVTKKERHLSKDEYDLLNPKPAPSFCQAKKSS